MEKICRPYSDDFLYFNEETGHYELTEKALTDKIGLDLRARLSRDSTITPEVVINHFLQTVSDMIYQFIHEYNVDNHTQDYLIATVPEFRRIIQKAMEYQAVYVSNVGNLYLSTKPEERAIAIDYLAQSVLNTTVPCLGRSILYAGVY